MKQTLTPYIQLARLHRPIGILLLLWPTLWALWLANSGSPPVTLVVIFIAGAVLSRSAGCVINDLCDQGFDAHVWRTAQRPLVTGQLTRKQAWRFLFFLLSLCLILVLQLDRFTLLLSTVGLLLAMTYPLAKRFISFPQLHLGLAFGWAIPMAFSASHFSTHPPTWEAVTLWVRYFPENAIWLYVITILWAMAYDTQYAMADRADDLKIGVRSTAILFGRYDLVAVASFQFLMLGLLVWVGWRNQFSLGYFFLLCLTPLFFLWQFHLTRFRDPSSCFAAFIHNHWVGLWLFLAFLFA
jgi:4-hydroxybenzoate polyprenyltransferase